MTTHAHEIVNVRLLKAPPAAVFAAWTDPKLLAQWWGPEGFTNTFHRFEPVPGGTWKFTMHSPDGKDFDNESIFREVVANERIVFDHLEPVHAFRLTATFAEKDGGTELTFRMVFENAAECERVRPYVQQANEQNIDRLTTVLAAN